MNLKRKLKTEDALNAEPQAPTPKTPSLPENFLPFIFLENYGTHKNLFNNDSFSSALRQKMLDTKTTFSSLESQTKVNRSMLCLAAQGNTPSLETYLRLCIWLAETKT